MKVLVACECSQVVTLAFRELGHEAFSCDLQECYGGHSEWHIKDDVLKILNDNWDLIIAHPPCTYLSVVGNAYFDISRYGDYARERLKLRQEAFEFFLKFTNLECQKVCIENPCGYTNTHYRKTDQIINPYQFGDPYEKRICLWLKGLNPLIDTCYTLPEERFYFASGHSNPTWYARLYNLPKAERQKLRAQTFPGIARAMASQWSDTPKYW